MLAGQAVWLPVDMLGGHFGRLCSARREQAVAQIISILDAGG